MIAHQKLDQSGLLYRLKSADKKVGANTSRHFQASWASQPMGCLLLYYH